jgi:aspartate aminotransferase-like enzyme
MVKSSGRAAPAAAGEDPTMSGKTSWPMMTLASGPVEVSERTLREQSRPVLYHYDPAFIDLFERTTSLLQRVFRTRYDVIIMQGERYGVMISGGYGELAGKLIRLGHMGKAAHPTYLAAQIAVLERSLADLGFRLKLGTGVGAAMEALDRWGQF